MSKNNITQYGDQELSLHFQNDEFLYKEWNRAVSHGSFSAIKDLCDEYFEYTEEQIEELENDFNNEVEEYEKEN